MRSRLRLGAGTVALVAALAAGGVGMASASSSAPGRQVNCKFDVKAVWRGNHRGTDRADLRCGKPLGRGLEHDSYTAITTAKKATLTDEITESFPGGTLRGRLEMIRGYLYPGPPTFYTWQYVGGGHITSGAGAYSHARGIALVICDSQDQGIHMTCELSVKLTGI
jgi:hypothetical protein